MLPEQFLQEIIAKTSPATLYTIVFQKEVCPEEIEVEERVSKLNCNIVHFWNSTLLHEDDIVLSESFPQTFTSYNKANHKIPVRK